jgi:uncharacterized protein (TIGR04255 family)
MTTPEAVPRPKDLPDYTDPPIDEVVIGLMFMSVGGVLTNHIAKYRDAVKNDLPGLQYQARLPLQLETLSDGGLQPQPPFGFAPLIMPQGIQPGQRTWLVSANDESVVQLQDDLFMSNWRRRQGSYPHFEQLMKVFWERFSLFRDQINDDMAIPLQLQQLEVTYINWVPTERASLSHWFGPAKASHVQLESSECDPEHELWFASFLAEKDGVPIARLHARQLEALRTAPGTPHLGSQLDLIYRAPLPPGIDDIGINDLAFAARNSIVRAFASLTTPEAEKLWNRTK